MKSADLLGSLKKYTMVIALVVVTILFSILTDGKILLPMNITNLIAQNAYVYILATGMLVCILTGGNIDLSVGSVVCFVGAIGATMMDKGGNIWVAVLVMLIVGAIIGAFQGFWIAYVKVPPFIATLAGMLAFRGLSNVVLDGHVVSVKNEAFINVFGGGANCFVPDFLHGNGINLTCILAGVIACVLYIFFQVKDHIDRVKKGYASAPVSSMIIKSVLICAVVMALCYKLALNKGLPSALIWVVLVVLIYTYVTTKTTIGRYLYAIGGNEKATKLSGINVERVYFLAYTNMGLLAGLAGILTIARMTSSQPTYGQSYEMDAIGSCFIGGASAYGGIGTVPGVVVGATLMGVINLGMVIIGVDTNYQKVTKGAVLLVAVIFDVLTKKEKK